MKKTKSKCAKSKPETDSHERYRKGWFRTDAGSIARFEADTPDEWDQAKEVIEAGFRFREEAGSWGMNPDDAWQLAFFPMKHEDWTKRMERLAAHSLHDEDASDLAGLMHQCTWMIEPLWKWLHHLAEHAQNSNIKRDAGQTLGRLYHEAGQAKNKKRLRVANQEFERQIAPFGGIKAKPAKALVHWVNRQLSWQLELWKRAVEVARRLKEKRPYYEYCVSAAHPSTEPSDDVSEWGMKLVGVHPMNSMHDAWKGYFSENRTRKGESWNDFLDELEDHPFRRSGLALEQLIDFDSCWNEALEPVLRQQWAKLDAQERRGIGKDLSFEHRIGTVKDPHAGYWVAKDFFDRFFLLHWEQVQKFDRLFNQSIRRVNLGTGTAVDPVAKKILA